MHVKKIKYLISGTLRGRYVYVLFYCVIIQLRVSSPKILVLIELMYTCWQKKCEKREHDLSKNMINPPHVYVNGVNGTKRY